MTRTSDIVVAAQLQTRDGSTEHRLLLQVSDLSVDFRFGGTLIYAVDGVSFSLDSGKTLGIIGESGSGKSVTARAIMGLLPGRARISGSIRFLGRELVGLRDREMSEYRGKEIALVPQDPSRSLNPTIKIGKQITEALRRHVAMSKGEAKERAIELLGKVRLPAPSQRFFEYPHQLSGGMRQRVVIAMALACNPKLLIADEATTALDVTTQAQIMELLCELQSEFGMAMILISHDMAIAATYTDEVAVMYAGSVVEQANTERIFNSIRMPYTRALMDAIPRIEGGQEVELAIVEGRRPDPTVRSVGCAFAPRCTRAADRCTEERPPLLEHEADHRFACFFPLGAGEAGAVP